MFQTNPNRQGNIEFVYIEDLVPEDHLLRKIDETDRFLTTDALVWIP